ncbi:hypothetical protein pETSU_273 [Edwardsiella phage pEt-SU]|uniref:Uncharacterized protein n=1 Tax=Edwardsiella phage pEt-SU TaxID=2562142 RepID=A0A4D6DX35_9CAUD|nr:hypothetical protein HOV39_gp249 [Edwardsiella phage pEt-SU]QBZ70854.1 hypothetical protein pETSU_273 [Edwardsiella phage pEt-SU]
MKVTLLLETIITSGLSMIAQHHGGTIDTQAKLRNILTNAAMTETGHIQGRTHEEIQDLIAHAVESRDLSLLIDITKEIGVHRPGDLLGYSRDVKRILEESGYTTEPLYLARDNEMINPGHVSQHLATGQVLYRLRQVYVSISNTALCAEDRLKAVNIFISMLICNPHLQRRVIDMCLTPAVMANHFDPLMPEARLVRLKHVLTQMASDTMYNLEQEDKPPVVPPLNLVDDEPEENYVPKPVPWLHFSGTDHLVAMKQEHGSLQEQLSVFHGLLTTKEGTPEARFRNAVAYVHRSEYQPALCKLLFDKNGIDYLETLHDNRYRAELVGDAIRKEVSKKPETKSIYSHPGRAKAVQIDPGTGKTKSPMAQALAIAEEQQRSVVKNDIGSQLNELIRIFGPQARIIPFGGANLPKDPLAAVKAIMAQLDFGNTSDTVHTSETTERIKTALPGLFNEDGTLNMVAICTRAKDEPKAPEPKPIEISGGDQQLRDDIIAMFQARGVKYKVVDDVPNIGIHEVHTYQIQVGGAIVALQHTPFDKSCKLTAHPVEGKASMKPLNWQAPTEHVPEIWDEIRNALNYQDAYWRINHFLDEAGYDTY